MSTEKDEYRQMEEWLRNYFLDPLTSYADQTQFRIDLFETHKDWIVEATLTDFDSSEISVFIEKDRLTITAAKHPSGAKKVRIIDFPFPIISQKVIASFSNGILEVFISKTEKEMGRNRYITLP